MMSKKIVALFILTIASQISYSQGPKYIYRNAKDSLRNFYVVRQPADSIKGAIVLVSIGLSDSAKKAAYAKGILLMTAVPTDNYLDFLTGNLVPERLDSMISEAILKYKIPRRKIVIGGMSAAGTAAVRFAEYCSQGKSAFGIRPLAVFAADPPLDYERLYNESENAVLRNYSSDAVTEGKQLMSFFKDKLKGTPGDNRPAYQQASPFSHTAKQGGNASVLTDMHVRMYTEPDINWWINNRRKDFYDLNVLDIAAFINQLKLLGNNKAELIATSNKGYSKDGSRHPHSWSIVDEADLLNWCIQIFENH